VDVCLLLRILVEDYGSYASSFIRTKHERIEEVLHSNLGKDMIWPAPLIQLNTSFEEGRDHRGAGRGGHPARGGVHA
jgi:hypothetical protein